MTFSTTLTGRRVLTFLVFLISYFLAMDILLYTRVQKYDVRPTPNGTVYRSPIPCGINPLCTVTVKGLMLDHPNHYFLSPLAAFVEDLLGIGRSWKWLTPNAISGFHVLVALAAAKCISSDSLSHRRLGVLLFQARTWLDDLDGRVARVRAHVEGERSDVGSTGYIVDGVCDGLGCIALLIGLYRFLSRNAARRGYDKLPQWSSSTSILEPLQGGWKTSNAVLRDLLLVCGHLLLTSATWNRYISLYQDILEKDFEKSGIGIDCLHARQTHVFRSASFWIVVLFWKCVNFHAALDYLLLAIFLDCVWEYVSCTRWWSIVLILLLVYITELHVLRVFAYVQGMPVFFEEEVYSAEDLGVR
ncbi:hypothetical protein KM043_003713 [Ampulex compressa]|nr:hypothetical protein KM043_003713 [Ampulex compressa]